MSELKKFQQTLVDAEKAAQAKLDAMIGTKNRKEICIEIADFSVSTLQHSFEKLLETMSPEEINNNKQHIDNVYYHLGVIKGCL